MLPETYMERIAPTRGLRTNDDPHERRRSVRVDYRWPGLMFGLQGRQLGPQTAIRLREISRGGCSLLTSRAMALGDLFVLSFTPKGQNAAWFWCKVRRFEERDSLSKVVGCEFMRLLYPGERITPQADLARLLWIKVDGQAKPTDPLLLLEETVCG